MVHWQVRRTSVHVFNTYYERHGVWCNSQSHLHGLLPERHNFQHYEGVTCFVMRVLSLLNGQSLADIIIILQYLTRRYQFPVVSSDFCGIQRT